ncbi:ankyrin repeat and SOCS box protein 17-like [Chanos chanos]|uniref:Ankyrin repeat and SOCS box protein 17-like n=1 Tax=Chanos chanos TaxID=29144 RepID=A0A6J2VFI4_CHACN|nr:ankyrin repeat and SOCS box protein 17 [Chanos chanos]
MSDTEDDQSSGGNIFLSLVRRVTRKPLYPFPVQWGHDGYQIFKTLSRILRNATAEEFDLFISDFIKFAKTTHLPQEIPFFNEFTHVCTSTILFWMVARRENASTVRRLMERTSVYLQDQTYNLTIAQRFTPIYGPGTLSGLTPVMFLAQYQQSDVLKVLLQYGMLERERRPSFIIVCILFSFRRLREHDALNYTAIIQDVHECLTLCFRVLTYISITDIEMQIIYGQTPLIKDWRDHIPVSRYLEPCELTHLCRTTLRRRLLIRGCLPDGIKRLPLPTRLQDYLNLEY